MSGALNEYEKKRVAVFGASGFLGAHLVKKLVPRAAHVVAFARGAASPALPALNGAEVVLGDIRNRENVLAAARGADVVFMLAGRSGAVSSITDAQEDLAVNCGGLLNLLDALRTDDRGARVIFPGSRLEYGKALSLPVGEDQPLDPLVPYGLHKTFCEAYLSYFARLYGISYGVARLTNPYGPWTSPLFRGYNVLNLMVQRAVLNQEVTVYGKGRQLRDYIYVDDVIDLLLLLGTGSANVVVNGGSGDGIAFADVAERIVELAGSGRVKYLDWPDAALAAETGDFVADIGRARSLGWSPKRSLDDGLRDTIAWHRAQ